MLALFTEGERVVMIVISTINQKGGVSKTTLAVNLAHALALDGKRVLLIDSDLQGNASTIISARSAYTLADVLSERVSLAEAIQPARDNLDVVTADRRLVAASRYITVEGRRAYYTLRRQMDGLTGYDIALIDHSPSYSSVSEACLLASSAILVPCELAPYAIEGLLGMFEMLERTLPDHALTLTGIVPFKLDMRYAMHEMYLKSLRERFGDRVLTPVRTDAAIPKSQSLHKTIYEYDVTSKAAHDIRALAKEIAGEMEVVA